MIPLLLVIVSCFVLTTSKLATFVDFKSHTYKPAVVDIEYEIVNRTYLNYNMTVLKVFNTDVLCSLNIKRIQKKKKMKSLFNWRHLNYCKFLQIYQADRLLKVFFANVIQPNFLVSCPLREGFYYLKNAFIDVGLIEKIMPHGLYHIQIDVTITDDGIERVVSNFAQVSF